MATTGDLITRASIVNDFNSIVRSGISYTYSSSHLPSPDSGFTGDTYPERFSSGIQTMSVSDIGNSRPINASTLVSDIQSFVRNYYSQIRKITIVHRNTGENTNVVKTTTGIARLTGSYTQSVPSLSIGVGTNTFIRVPNYNNILSTWRSISNNNAFTITYYHYVSHSSHGSRVRR